MAKTITFTLDAPSVNAAIREMEAYIEEVKAKIMELARILTEEEGVHIATVEISAVQAVDTGELADSIYGFYDPQSHVGTIGSKAEYAFYVEYGTGIVGAGSPHPEINGDWQPPPSRYTHYDTNNHGEAGWWYIASHRDGKLHWTRGVPSRPFMYNTFKQLEQRSRQLAAEIFNR